MKDLQKINKTKKRFILVSCMLIVLGIVFVFAMFPFLRIRFLGISLKPTGNIPLRQITYHTQKDPRWQEDLIGNSGSTIGKSGCLVTCISIAASDLDDKPVTPKELNQMMTQVDGYDGASLLWYKINDAIPSLNYYATRVFSADTIESDLTNGLMPIVKVKMHGIGAAHWVMIIGAQDGQFMIFDPLYAAKQPIPLSTYGRVYSYRVIRKDS